MPRRQNQIADPLNELVGKFCLTQNVLGESSALGFVVRRARIVDCIVKPKRHLNRIRFDRQVSDGLEFLQAIQYVDERMVTAMRFGVASDQIFEDRQRFACGRQPLPQTDPVAFDLFKRYHGMCSNASVAIVSTSIKPAGMNFLVLLSRIANTQSNAINKMSVT